MKTVAIKHNWLLESDLRFDASFHLSDGVKTRRIIEKHCPYPTTDLKKEAKELFKGDIHKRVYVDSPDNGIMFYSASDMFKSNLNTGKYLSKKYSPHLNQLMLQKDWILITRSGTLGKVIYTTSDFEGKIGTDDLVRIKPKEDKLKGGYLYAFLTSKYGYGLLTQSGYGGVVKHIEPHQVENISVPILPNDLQSEINELIIESKKLRVQGNKSLNKAHSILLDSIKFQPKVISGAIKSNKMLSSHQKRFESQYYISGGSEIIEFIKTGKFKYLRDLSSAIFRPGIFKRYYVDEGLEFLGGTELVRTIPKSEKKLSLVKTKHLNELKVKEDWILVTCGGTIGNSVLVNDYLSEKTASQHILRVVSNNVVETGYLFAFISSKLGLKAIQSFAYGSVIPQIEPHHLELLPIPIINKDKMLEIHNLVMNYKEDISNSIHNELKAISIVEKEIESWQK